MGNRRGWTHIATQDVGMREALRHITIPFPGQSALDVVDGLVGIIDQYEIQHGLYRTVAAKLAFMLTGDEDDAAELLTRCVDIEGKT